MSGRYVLYENLTRAHTSYFNKRERTWGGGGGGANPIPLMGVIELRDKDHWIVWDVPIPMV